MKINGGVLLIIFLALIDPLNNDKNSWIRYKEITYFIIRYNPHFSLVFSPSSDGTPLAIEGQRTCFVTLVSGIATTDPCLKGEVPWDKRVVPMPLVSRVVRLRARKWRCPFHFLGQRRRKNLCRHRNAIEKVGSFAILDGSVIYLAVCHMVEWQLKLVFSNKIGHFCYFKAMQTLICCWGKKYSSLLQVVGETSTLVLYLGYWYTCFITMYRISLVTWHIAYLYPFLLWRMWM